MKVEERIQSRFFSEYVGGMGGLIFQEIREARGLAYSAWGYHDSGGRPVDDSAIVGGLGTQVDKSVEAISKMLELIPLRTIDEKRFANAKRSLEQQYRNQRFDPRRVADMIFYWQDHGLAGDPRPDEWKALAGLTPDSVLAWSKTYLGKPIISIMTDASRVPPASLKAFGKVVTKKVDQLVSY
jgi:predicted Zn-dependent peptidase